MQQQRLPMLTHYEAPKLVDRELVMACRSYREAVRACWEIGKRKRSGYTMRQLAEDIGSYPSHVSDYLAEDDKPTRRDLPAKRVNEFECEMGNRLVSQWLNWRAGLVVVDEPVLEQLQQLARRVA